MPLLLPLNIIPTSSDQYSPNSQCTHQPTQQQHALIHPVTTSQLWGSQAAWHWSSRSR